MSIEKIIAENTEAVKKLTAVFAENTEAVKKLTAVLEVAMSAAIKDSTDELINTEKSPPKSKQTKKADEPTKKPESEKPVVTDEDLLDEDLLDKAKYMVAKVKDAIGVDAVKEILSHYGAKKFSEVDTEDHVLKDLISRCQIALDDQTDKEDEESRPPESGEDKKLTLADVKPLIMDIATDPQLGKPAVSKILGKFGAKVLSAVEAENYPKLKIEAEKVLKGGS